MSEIIKIGLVGCGLRGTGYITYMRMLGFNFRVTALADVDDVNLKSANRDFANNEAVEYSTGEELINNADINAVIIATPNKYHRKPAIAAMERELPMLLEKPIATTVDDLQAMWDNYHRRKPKLVVGFCMRFVPFYNQIRKVIDKGTLGQILTINAEELLSDRLSMIFCRSQWRPDTSLSGPILLEKCCHDIDMINWMAGAQANRISSYARKTFLVPGKAPDRKCQNCPEESTCRFSQKRVLESFKFNITETKTQNWALYSKLINNRCPYFTGSPYPDHQSVMIEYENGVLATFNFAQAQPANRRTIHILGSEARLYGVVDDDYFTIFHRTGPNDEKAEKVRIDANTEYGHNGGDPILTSDFWNLLHGIESPWRPGLKEGIESAIMCLLAEESVKLGSSIELAPTRRQVFHTEIVPPVQTHRAVPIH